jgi:glycerol dehydrogenase-like iron-containing ADH family enzyme
MITHAAPTVPGGILFVSEAGSSVIRTAFDGYQGALIVLDPELRQEFVTYLLPLLRKCVPVVRPLLPGHFHRDGDVVVAFGGGRVLDTAKLRAAELGVDWIAMPTKPTAAAFSATASVKDARGVVTELVRPPRHVLVMPDLMARTPIELLQAEIADTWSFHTAMSDVVLDAMINGREWDTTVIPIFNEATRLLAPLHAEDLRIPAVLEGFTSVQKMLAEVTNEAQTTRYVSGTEHLVAHSLAAHGCALPHGVLVGIGIILGRLLQVATTPVNSTLESYGFVHMPDSVWHRLEISTRNAVRAGAISANLLEQTLLTSKFIRHDHRHTVLDSVFQSECQAASRTLCKLPGRGQPTCPVKRRKHAAHPLPRSGARGKAYIRQDGN